jgi:hypothetical protein
MNMGLVLGAGDVADSKAFKDHGEGMAEKFPGGGGGAPASKGAANDKSETDAAAAAKAAEADKKKGQADDAVSTDATETPKV